MSAISTNAGAFLPRRLLGVWAHPDDEAYLSAGLMARVIAAGGHVTVVTATSGEKGTDDPNRFGQSAFGDFREAEMFAAMRTLGVTDVRFLRLPDGGCRREDVASVDAIRAIIDEVDPDAIVTFGPDGITHHEDHRAVSAWATEAWIQHGRGDLFYAALTERFGIDYHEMHTSLGLFADCPTASPALFPTSAIALGCSLSDRELDIKRACLAAHGSQTDGLAAVVGEPVYRTWWRNETFRRPTEEEIIAARFRRTPQLVGAS